MAFKTLMSALEITRVIKFVLTRMDLTIAHVMVVSFCMITVHAKVCSLICME